MEKLLANYLFQFKTCPLPSLGTLHLHAGNAGIVAGEKKIVAPLPTISLEQAEESPAHLLAFMAQAVGSSEQQAAASLYAYCDRLKSLATGMEAKLGGAGYFYKTEEEILAFSSAEPKPEFLPTVRAERVIRANVAHHMLVGDTETDTTTMNERLQEAVITSRSRWWIAAIVALALAIGTILLYMNSYNTGLFGNAQPVKAGNATPTYITGEK